MNQRSRFAVIRALKSFISYSPGTILLLNLSSILQGLSAVMGLLLIIPLAQIAGVDFQTKSSNPLGFLTFIADFINSLGITQSLVQVLFLYALLSIIITYLSYLRSIYSVKIQQGYVMKMRMQIYNTLMAAKWEYLSSTRSSDFLHRLGTQVQIMNGAANQMIVLFHQALGMIIAIALMFALNWKFTLMTIVCGFIVMIVVFPVRWHVRDAGVRQLQGYKDIFRLLADHLGSLKMIKSSGREWFYQDKLAQVSHNLELQEYRRAKAGAIISLANRLGISIGFCIILYLSVTYLQMPVANFFMLMLIMARILPQIAALQGSAQRIVFAIPAYLDIEETLMTGETMREHNLITSSDSLAFKNTIELNDVSFTYPNTKNKIFESLTLSIHANKTLALIGPSGIGKTTLADMIVGLLSPTKGELTIDGQRLEGEVIAKWRRSVAYVTQEVYLFNDTIRNNLLWVNPEVSDNEIWQKLDVAVMKQRIENAPRGLDSVIGERGLRLSGGERQRLALARALLAKPKLLILDEATSALDKKNENLIHQALANMRGSLTIIIIAHRHTTIKHADEVLDLNKSTPRLLTKKELDDGFVMG